MLAAPVTVAALAGSHERLELFAPGERACREDPIEHRRPACCLLPCRRARAVDETMVELAAAPESAACTTYPFSRRTENLCHFSPFTGMGPSAQRTFRRLNVHNNNPCQSGTIPFVA
jgi:hypothetical protein